MQAVVRLKCCGAVWSMILSDGYKTAAKHSAIFITLTAVLCGIININFSKVMNFPDDVTAAVLR